LVPLAKKSVGEKADAHTVISIKLKRGGKEFDYTMFRNYYEKL
jgi:hypothetical protein